ncbi:MAG: hypothetical protein HDS26_06990 [Bacteroides sp.]|nr:hypothetical protein [Bacteroides sp.]
MKKFYAFAAAALMSAAAFAQDGAPLYITGANIPDSTGEWNAEAPEQFEYVDGQYVFEGVNLTQFKISTACGDWDTFNAGCYGCSYGKEPGVAVALEAGNDSNISTPWKGDYKIVVAGDLSTITMTTDTPQPAEGPTAVYVRGDMNGWGAEAEWQFEALNDQVYKFVMAEGQVISLGETFKFADADWNEINVGGDGNPLLIDFPNVVFNGGNPANFSLEEEFNGVIWLGLGVGEDGVSMTELSTDKEYVPEWGEVGENSVNTIAAENAAALYFNLQGVRVANPENGLYIVVKDGKASKVVVK